ncbi:hypothetical protein FBU30_009208 [Linnemannia zychae]|nr:hypothetical protein FBU30_009208 [Linnemannia zychae]
MGDAGFFKGTSAEQDARFADKTKKLLRSMNFPPEFNQKVDMKKVNMKVIKGWMAERVVQLLGIEDEVVVEYAVGMLEEPSPDPKTMQINLQGFLDKNTQQFVLELWRLLISAQNSLGGIPQQFLDITKAELMKAKQSKEEALAKIREQEEKERAIAAELKQKAQAIREATRPKALDIGNKSFGEMKRDDNKPVQDDRRAHEERRNREYEREREKERDRERGRYDRSRSRDGRRYDSRREDRYRERSRDRDYPSRSDYYSRRDDDYYRGGSRRRSHSRSRDYSRERNRSHREDYSGRDRGRDRSQDRARDRNGRHSIDLDADSSRRKRERSQSRSRSRSRSRAIRKDARTRSQTPPSATNAVSSNGDSKETVSALVETSAAASVDPKILENQLREKLLRERVLQSVKNKRASTDATATQEQDK